MRVEEKIAEAVPYNEVKKLWRLTHWDFTYTGICSFENKMCYFRTDDSDEDILVCDIYKLNLWHKTVFINRHLLFTVLVRNGLPHGNRLMRFWYDVINKKGVERNELLPRLDDLP